MNYAMLDINSNPYRSGSHTLLYIKLIPIIYINHTYQSIDFQQDLFITVYTNCSTILQSKFPYHYSNSRSSVKGFQKYSLQIKFV